MEETNEGETNEVKGRYGVPTIEVTGVVAAGSRRGQDLLDPSLEEESCDMTLSGASF